jgi:hypothetical protein
MVQIGANPRVSYFFSDLFWPEKLKGIQKRKRQKSNGQEYLGQFCFSFLLVFLIASRLQVSVLFVTRESFMSSRMSV